MNPIYEHAEFAVESGMGSRLESEFGRVRDLLLRAKGCRSVELARSVDVADTYLLRVGWDSLADHTEVFPGTAEAEELIVLLQSLTMGPPRVVHWAG